MGLQRDALLALEDAGWLSDRDAYFMDSDILFVEAAMGDEFTEKQRDTVLYVLRGQFNPLVLEQTPDFMVIKFLPLEEM